MHKYIALGVSLLAVVSARSAFADSGGGYPLDILPRETPVEGRLACPNVELETYAGTSMHYQKPVTIYVGFQDKLRRFEEIARDTAIEVYGRAPITLRHDGAYDCRRTRGFATLLSEHALGNALDVDGFDFGPAPAGSDAPEGLHHAFSVNVSRHWGATTGTAALHAHFLRLLAERVIDAEVFRVVLGPSYPGHEGHFHLDEAPYRLVHVFGYDPRHSSHP